MSIAVHPGASVVEPIVGSVDATVTSTDDPEVVAGDVATVELAGSSAAPGLAGVPHADSSTDAAQIAVSHVWSRLLRRPIAPPLIPSTAPDGRT